MGDAKNDIETVENMISAYSAIISADPLGALNSGALEKMFAFKQQLRELQGGGDDLD